MTDRHGRKHYLPTSSLVGSKYHLTISYRQHKCWVHLKEAERRNSIVVINLPQEHENLQNFKICVSLFWTDLVSFQNGNFLFVIDFCKGIGNILLWNEIKSFSDIFEVFVNNTNLTTVISRHVLNRRSLNWIWFMHHFTFWNWIISRFNRACFMRIWKSETVNTCLLSTVGSASDL